MFRNVLFSMFFLLLVASQLSLAASKVPVSIVTPFLQSVSLARSSNTDIIVVIQNNAGLNQTITSIVPEIPSGGLVTASIIDSNCGFLLPMQTCEAVARINSLEELGNEKLNISVCSFNGALCSRIKQPITVANVPLTKISVFPTNPSIASGSTLQFQAVGTFADKSTKDVTNAVSWTSSNNTKATISNMNGFAGLATAVATGASVMTASRDGVSGSSTLTVTAATLSSITVIPVRPSIANGTTRQFYAVGIYSDNTYQNLTDSVNWNTSNAVVATVDNASGTKGVASGKSVGQATITATLGGVSGAATLTVSAAVLTDISVTPTHPETPRGTTQQFTSTGIYSDNTTQDLTKVVTWSTASTLTAIITNRDRFKGLALTVNEGSTTVSATLGSITGSTIINVTPAVLSSIYVEPTNFSLAAGEEQQYKATGIFTDFSTEDLTSTAAWETTNNAIATASNAVGSKGLIHGLSVGAVSVTASQSGVEGGTSLAVTAATLQSIAVTPAALTIGNGAEQQYKAIGTYSDATTQDMTGVVTWLSSAPAVAVISNATGSKGLATTVAAGATTLTAAFEGVSGNTTLTVSAATLTSIAVTPANSTIPQDTSEQFTAVGTYSDLSTHDVTAEVTWASTDVAKATVSNAADSKGLVTGVSAGSTTIRALLSGIVGSTPLTIAKVKVGDNLDGGIVACLNGGLESLIAAVADNSPGIGWGGVGTITNAQSDVDGLANTDKIVGVVGAGLTYAAGVCDAYEIDSAGNTPCVGGNTCYNDWFLPSINQLSCVRKNRNQVGGFNGVFYWSSTEYSVIPNFSAWFMTFANSGESPAAGNKADPHAVRCVRLMTVVP